MERLKRTNAFSKQSSFQKVFWKRRKLHYQCSIACTVAATSLSSALTSRAQSRRLGRHGRPHQARPPTSLPQPPAPGFCFPKSCAAPIARARRPFTFSLQRGSNFQTDALA